MFEFLNKKPTGTPPGKDAAAPPEATPVRSGWSPEELATAFDQVQEEKAGRQPAPPYARRSVLRQSAPGRRPARRTRDQPDQRRRRRQRHHRPGGRPAQ